MRPLGYWAECTSGRGMALRRGMIAYMPKGGVYAPPAEQPNYAGQKPGGMS